MERKFGQIIQKGALAGTIIGSTLLSQNPDTFKAPFFQIPEPTTDYIEKYKVYPPDFEQNKEWYISRAVAIEQAYQVLNPLMKERLRPYFDDGSILEDWGKFTTDEKSLRYMGQNFVSTAPTLLDHSIPLAEVEEGEGGLIIKKRTASILTRLVESAEGIKVDYVDFDILPTERGISNLEMFTQILDTSKIPPGTIEDNGPAGWSMDTVYQGKAVHVSYNIHGFLRVYSNPR